MTPQDAKGSILAIGEVRWPRTSLQPPTFTTKKPLGSCLKPLDGRRAQFARLAAVLKHYATKKPGRYRCGEKECRKDFTVMTGTVMERSHATHSVGRCVPDGSIQQERLFSATSFIASWAASTIPLGSCIIASWKRCAVAASICRRWAAKAKLLKPTKPISAIFPRRSRRSSRRLAAVFQTWRLGPAHKRAIIALVERGGEVRSFSCSRRAPREVVAIVRKNIASREPPAYRRKQALHAASAKNLRRTKPSSTADKEYARGDVTTNTVEGYFSVFKRGMRGVYQHCAEKHLHRYLGGV